MAYELFCGSVQGASHIRSGTPCEDYGVKVDCGKHKVFAVADGHGDSNCLRSSVGSRLICEIASKVLDDFACAVEDMECEERLFDEREAKGLVRDLIDVIVTNWRDAVRDHLVYNPLTDEQLESISPSYRQDYLSGIGIERLYGTTLIAGLQTDSYLLLLQQGDGRCVVYDNEGNASQPIPWDERCVGTITTSLCDVDASQSVRYHVINLRENPVVACVAGTDGVEDSFPQSLERLHAYYRELFRYACENGLEVMEADLVDEFNDLSSRGSADDITVSGIVDIERMREFIGRFDEQNKAIELENEVASLSDQVRDIECGGKYEYLRRQYDEMREVCDTLQKRLEESVAICAMFEEKIVAHEEGSSIINGKGGLTTIIRRWMMNEVNTEIVNKLVLPEVMLEPLRRVAAEEQRQMEQLEQQLRDARIEFESVEREYIPYKERYERLLHEREDAIERLKNFSI